MIAIREQWEKEADGHRPSLDMTQAYKKSDMLRQALENRCFVDIDVVALVQRANNAADAQIEAMNQAVKQITNQ